MALAHKKYTPEVEHNGTHMIRFRTERDGEGGFYLVKERKMHGTSEWKEHPGTSGLEDCVVGMLLGEEVREEYRAEHLEWKRRKAVEGKAIR